jgi:SAM-dependent methyltransferase
MPNYTSEIDFYKTEVVNPTWLNSRILNDGITDYPEYFFNKTSSKVLEIGCGPCSSLYYGIKNKLINVTCVDACADEYKRILNNDMYHPIIQGFGEDIAEMFYMQSFDIMFMQNSLDHTIDPTKVIRNCLSLLRLGGELYLSGFINEGKIQQYHGLHQHNFNVVDGILYYSNEECDEYDFMQDIDPSLKVIHWSNIDVVDDRKWFTIIYRKI